MNSVLNAGANRKPARKSASKRRSRTIKRRPASKSVSKRRSPSGKRKSLKKSVGRKHSLWLTPGAKPSAALKARQNEAFKIAVKYGMRRGVNVDPLTTFDKTAAAVAKDIKFYKDAIRELKEEYGTREPTDAEVEAEMKKWKMA